MKWGGWLVNFYLEGVPRRSHESGLIDLQSSGKLKSLNCHKTKTSSTGWVNRSFPVMFLSINRIK